MVRVVGLGNSKLCEFPQRGACTISVKNYYTAWSRFSRQTRRGSARTQALSSTRGFLGNAAELRTLASTLPEKPSTEHGFLGKSGADLPGPKHVAQKRSTVLPGPEHLLAKFHRARLSLQTRRGPKHFAQEPARSTVFSAKPARSCTNPSSANSARTCADLSI